MPVPDKTYLESKKEFTTILIYAEVFVILYRRKTRKILE